MGMIAPFRVSIVDLDTGDEISPQFNPETLEEGGDPVFDRIAAQGQSQEFLHFKNKKNWTGKLDLRWHSRNEKQQADLLRARILLEAWKHPRGADAGTFAGPPRLLFVWPGTVSMEVRLVACAVRLTEFAPDGKPTAMTATVTLEERNGTRVTADEVAARVATVGGSGAAAWRTA